MSISPRIGVLGVGYLMYQVIPGMMRADPALLELGPSRARP
jgi:hypothetical protein